MKRAYPKSSLKTLLGDLAAIEAGAELGIVLAGEDDDYIHYNTQWHIRTCLAAHFGRKPTERDMKKLRRQLSATLESIGGEA